MANESVPDRDVTTEPLSLRDAAESAAAAWIARRDTPGWDAAAFEKWLAESVSHRVAWYRLNAAWHEAGRLGALTGAGRTSAVLKSAPEEVGSSPDPVDSQANAVDSPADAVDSRADTVDSPADAVNSPTDAVDSPRERQSRGETHRRFRPFERRARWALAASVVLGLGIGAAIYEFERAPPSRFSTVVGGLQAVPLADGSRVTLNTDSEVQVALEARERVVNLDRGEAYFEVAKDPSWPFIVNVGTKRVIAVGTQFSVRRNGDEVSVVVTEGTVRIEGRRPRPPSLPGAAQSEALSPAAPGSELTTQGSVDVVLLPAGSVARAQGEAVLVKEEPPAEIEQHLSWRNGQLIFRDTALADAVAEFNRYNERKIVIEDPGIAKLQLGGIFRSTNIDPFIELLEQGFPVRATVEGNRILLTHN